MTLYIGWQFSFRHSTSRLPFYHSSPFLKRTFASRFTPNSRKFRRTPWVASAFLLSGLGLVSYDPPQQVAHTLHAVRRCSRVAEAVVPSAIDYKRTLLQDYDSETLRQGAMSECHTRSAKRVLRAMLANGGIYIKMGQTMASLAMLPQEWTDVMRVLQDQCDPTPYEDLERLFITDMGQGIHEIFDDFNPNPIGVASLAQVHVGRYKKTGQLVAVKLQHPHLAEFSEIDMETVEVAMGWVKHWFPEFEFTWLGEEMRENLPKEMDFAHEARNADRAVEDFKGVRTSLYIPEVLFSSKRVLVMEYIQGGRVDDLEYLDAHSIDRNKVAIELSNIFSRMVHLSGWFHADPHPGNLLIRPAPRLSHSPYNFEIVLLDHGLYFDLDDELRINYSKLMLALMSPNSTATRAERRKYARLVGNVGDDLYPVFEAALTGRAHMDDSLEDSPNPGFKRGSSLVELSPQTPAEIEAIRSAVVNKEGLLVSVFDVLRRVPRRVLMVLKLNELTRHLDLALATTHSHVRIFLVTAKFCSRAVWLDEKDNIVRQLREQHYLSLRVWCELISSWWRFKTFYLELGIAERVMDWHAETVKMTSWLRGFWKHGGFVGAHRAAAGLV
ncbi:ABC1-domain-containing protein [Thelephora terrestris]|uniref:ABC1-domain-containing protein n=1 Tax=Thelephora terrestris TaxID=56493 RepID=A0A9P6LC24_9AGAM|nr:ABC1-domain-containing protein [Thelephora terrestris]